MLSGKSEIAENRLAVTAVQIVERLKIRSNHLDQLLNEELDVGTRRLQLQDASGGNDMMGLESLLTQIQSERRREDTECWRDLTNVMRDFLNAWESVAKNEAKNRFISALPPTSIKTKARQTYGLPSNTPKHYQNDYRNTSL
jgi:hypothetical protein